MLPKEFAMGIQRTLPAGRPVGGKAVHGFGDTLGSHTDTCLDEPECKRLGIVPQAVLSRREDQTVWEGAERGQKRRRLAALHFERVTSARSVKIEPGVTIEGPCWIGHGSVIRAGATVTRSILFEYTRIAANMHFKEMIVSPEYCVNRAGETRYRGDDTVQLRWGDSRA